MATPDSSGVERRRVRLDGNRPRTHPKRSSRKATKGRSASTERDDCAEDGDVLERISRALALVEAMAVAVQTHEDDRELGSIVVCLDLARCKVQRAHGAVDLALNQVPT
jgi:hypothetical protein